MLFPYIDSHKCEEAFDHDCEQSFESYSDLRKHILQDHIMEEIKISSENQKYFDFTKNSNSSIEESNMEISEENSNSEDSSNSIPTSHHSPEMVRGIFQKLTHFMAEQQLPK